MVVTVDTERRLKLDEREDQIGVIEVPQRRGPGRPPNPARRSSHSDERSAYTDNDRSQFDERDDNEEQYFANFRGSMGQSKLPNLPNIPGYHTCWLSTSHPWDPIQYRLRIGYELIRLEECATDMGAAALKTGEYPGVVAVSEMVGAKIPLNLYNRYMRENHEREPLEQEVGLRSHVERMRREIESARSRLDESEGMIGLGNRAKPMPAFTE